MVARGRAKHASTGSLSMVRCRGELCSPVERILRYRDAGATCGRSTNPRLLSRACGRAQLAPTEPRSGSMVLPQSPPALWGEEGQGSGTDRGRIGRRRKRGLYRRCRGELCSPAGRILRYRDAGATCGRSTNPRLLSRACGRAQLAPTEPRSGSMVLPQSPPALWGEEGQGSGTDRGRIGRRRKRGLYRRCRGELCSPAGRILRYRDAGATCGRSANPRLIS